MSQPFYITTPIYYVNDKPHIGHAYTTISADYLARFHKLANREVFFLTGTDEHGTKIAEAAEAAGMSEIKFCDQTSQKFKDAWVKLGIDNDYFIRTTSDRHLQAVSKILDVMRTAKTDDGQDVVYSSFYEGLYCNGCEKFITEKELVDGLCPDHQREPERVKEKNYFFRLTAFLPKIKEKIESGELKILPVERKREVLGLINQDLPDFSLSRERVKWGIPLSFDESQVAYVWVDALSNYISAIGYADDEKSFEKWWEKAEVVHLMAKDILKFHTLYWPAMLMAAGIKLPETIFIHGFFTINGAKMSKTLGNFLDPNELVEQYGRDGTRYLLLTQFPFGIDGDIQANRFILQYNSDLANDLGNLVSRVGKMVMVNFDGKLPAPASKSKEIDELIELAEALPGKVYEHVKNLRLNHAISDTMSLVKAANKFFNDTQPWILAKEGKKDELGSILYTCCEIIRIVSILLFPIMPDKMRELRKVLSLDNSTLSLENAQKFFELEAGTEIKVDQPIFPRMDQAKPNSSSEKSGESKGEDGLIDISEVGKLELVVAEVLQADSVEGADRLLKLQIDTGADKRQIIAGIAEYYKKEEMPGKKIIIVKNLKPAVIRGVESNGMLLAAKKGKKLFVLTPDGDLPPGAKVS